MTLPFSILFGFAAGIASAPEAEIDYLVERFRQACMRGEARFDAGQVSSIKVGDLKGDVRRSYGHIKNARYYVLKLSVPAYLVTWERKPSGYYYTRGCAVIAQDLPLLKTWEKVLKTTFSPKERSRLIEVDTRIGLIEYPLPEEGSKLSIKRVYGGDFVAMQVSAMSKLETKDWKGMDMFRSERSPKGGTE